MIAARGLDGLAWPWRLLILPWLGYGRMMEAYLAAVCAIAATVLIATPAEAWQTAALSDLQWAGSRWLAAPFVVKAILTGLGLWLNVRGVKASQYVRVAGSLVGFCIWFWLSFKLSGAGALLFAWAFCVPSAFISLRIFVFACLGLPPVGRHA